LLPASCRFLAGFSSEDEGDKLFRNIGFTFTGLHSVISQKMELCYHVARQFKLFWTELILITLRNFNVHESSSKTVLFVSIPRMFTRWSNLCTLLSNFCNCMDDVLFCIVFLLLISLFDCCRSVSSFISLYRHK
jgi:hypothetical protein